MSSDEEEIDVENLEDEDAILDENPLAHLPEYVLRRIDKLKELDSRRDEILDQYITERAALEKKYREMYHPLYDERALITKGDMDEEIFSESANSAPPPSEERVKGIPQFWACAMTQHEIVGEMIAEEDVDCLEYLQDITCVDNDDGKGFTLRFFFAPNDYFHDTVLTKSYDVPNLLLPSDPVLKKVDGCKIQWKEGMALTFRTVTKKQRGKGKKAGQVRTVTKQEERESFFHWFDPPEMPDAEALGLAEEDIEEIEAAFDDDFEIAQSFRNQIIPEAVKWFTGEAHEAQIMGATIGGTEDAE